MIATPFMIQMGPRIEEFITRNGKESDHILKETIGYKIEKHVIIAGYGMNGRNLSKVLSAVKIPFVIVEMNPETVISEKRKGLPIFYGDASKENVLRLTNISKAKILVVAISDPAHTRMMVNTARKLNPGIYIIARIRYINELEELYELGANEVIPEEFETSIEIFSRVLSRYLIPKEEIQKNVERVRKDGYEMIRDLYHKPRSFDDLGHYLTNIELETFRVMGGSIADGKTLAELNLRTQWGFTVLAIQRGNDVLNNPHGGDKLLEDDIVILMGNRERLPEVSSVFTAS
jgi:CPA2 family monovalent cation:H+ antiporter-2